MSVQNLRAFIKSLFLGVFSSLLSLLFDSSDLLVNFLLRHAHLSSNSLHSLSSTGREFFHSLIEFSESLFGPSFNLLLFSLSSVSVSVRFGLFLLLGLFFLYLNDSSLTHFGVGFLRSRELIRVTLSLIDVVDNSSELVF